MRRPPLSSGSFASSSYQSMVVIPDEQQHHVGGGVEDSLDHLQVPEEMTTVLSHDAYARSSSLDASFNLATGTPSLPRNNSEFTSSTATSESIRSSSSSLPSLPSSPRLLQRSIRRAHCRRLLMSSRIWCMSLAGAFLVALATLFHSYDQMILMRQQQQQQQPLQQQNPESKVLAWIRPWNYYYYRRRNNLESQGIMISWGTPHDGVSSSSSSSESYSWTTSPLRTHAHQSHRVTSQFFSWKSVTDDKTRRALVASSNHEHHPPLRTVDLVGHDESIQDTVGNGTNPSFDAVARQGGIVNKTDHSGSSNSTVDLSSLETIVPPNGDDDNNATETNNTHTEATTNADAQESRINDEASSLVDDTSKLDDDNRTPSEDVDVLDVQLSEDEDTPWVTESNSNNAASAALSHSVSDDDELHMHHPDPALYGWTPDIYPNPLNEPVRCSIAYLPSFHLAQQQQQANTAAADNNKDGDPAPLRLCDPDWVLGGGMYLSNVADIMMNFSNTFTGAVPQGTSSSSSRSVKNNKNKPSLPRLPNMNRTNLPLPPPRLANMTTAAAAHPGIAAAFNRSNFNASSNNMSQWDIIVEPMQRRQRRRLRQLPEQGRGAPSNMDLAMISSSATKASTTTPAGTGAMSYDRQFYPRVELGVATARKMNLGAVLREGDFYPYETEDNMVNDAAQIFARTLFDAWWQNRRPCSTSTPLAIDPEVSDPFGMGVITSSSSRTSNCLKPNETVDTHNGAASGVLMFMSIQDRVCFITTGSSISGILPWWRLDHIVVNMKPDLRHGEYGHALLQAIEDLSRMLESGPPTFQDRFHDFISRFGVVIGFAIFTFVFGAWGEYRDRHKRWEYAEQRSRLSTIDRDKARQLQQDYKTRRCPICLEKFEYNRRGDGSNRNNNNNNNNSQWNMSTSNRQDDDDDDDTSDNDCEEGNHSGPEDSNENPPAHDPSADITSSSAMKRVDSYGIPLRGADGKKIKLLRCGHIYCETCWRSWVHSGVGNPCNCPVCRQDVGRTPRKRLMIRNAITIADRERNTRSSRNTMMTTTAVSTTECRHNDTSNGDRSSHGADDDGESSTVSEPLQASRSLPHLSSQDDDDGRGGGNGDGAGQHGGRARSSSNPSGSYDSLRPTYYMPSSIDGIDNNDGESCMMLDNGVYPAAMEEARIIMLGGGSATNLLEATTSAVSRLLGGDNCEHDPSNINGNRSERTPLLSSLQQHGSTSFSSGSSQPTTSALAAPYSNHQPRSAHHETENNYKSYYSQESFYSSDW